MKIRLFVLFACSCAGALNLRAQDSPVPEPAPAPVPVPVPGPGLETAPAPFRMPLWQGKIEVEMNGKKETLDLADPATAQKLKGKVIIRTEINGRRETRVVDAKDAEKLPTPFLWNEKPLTRTGPVTFLGIGAIEVPADVAAQLTLPQDTGLQVALVLPESPAAKAGLQESDIIQKFEDQILVTPRQFGVLIANRKEGDVVKLSVLRKGAPLEIAATLGKRDVPHAAESPDKAAKVTREMFKLDGDFDKELARKLSDALHGETGPGEGHTLPPGAKVKLRAIEDIARDHADAVKAEMFPSRDHPAREDTGEAIRRALEKLPPEERPKIEAFLRENGVLPKNALPQSK